MYVRLLLLLCAALLLSACASQGGNLRPSPDNAIAPGATLPKLTSFTPQSIEPQIVARSAKATGYIPQSFDPELASVNPKNTTQNPESSAANTNQRQQIVVSQEVFTKTFSAVEELIANLNNIIRGKDYQNWVLYLSDDYRSKMSAVETLRQLNDSPTLQKLGVNLKGLEDYFSYVVVPSRANMRLDDLVFLSETEVEAIMVVGNRRVTVYRLIKIGDQWKIGPSL